MDKQDDDLFKPKSAVYRWNSSADANAPKDDDSPLEKFKPLSMTFAFDAVGEMPLAKSSVPLNKQPKNNLKPASVCIINHEKFGDRELDRHGSSMDVEALKQSFKKLGCPVELKSNPILSQVTSIVENLAAFDFTDISALVLVILSHGDRNEKIMACDNKPYDLNENVLHPLFQNETLKGKPKILIVQACKGTWVADGNAKSKRDPSEYIICYSTSEGFFSYRDKKDGTKFIQTFCKSMNEYALKKDFLEIINDVNRRVETETTAAGYKQVPSITSTLRSRYCFGDFC